MKVILHPEAHAEMIEQALYYEAKCEGLGSDFLAAVEETTRRIGQSPKAAPIERAYIRKRLVSGFPHTVLYEIESDRIYVAAVMHQHRRPGYWRKRVE
ncbi:MAG TPA: type II toxin-antitoxin system RelE/ParE family toxin [Pyrinomonadaceae bacterium]|nr:type II toxin-antitoxin system RelE/ParE family toxin [Pyrinomonadaceae bacterium]